MSFLLGKKKLKISIPKGWHEVIYKDAIELKENTLTSVQILSKLSGVSEEEIKKSTDLRSITYLAQSILFLQTDPVKNKPEFPRKVYNSELPWVNYYDVFDLGGCTVEQVADMQQYVTSKYKEIGEDRITDLDVVKMFPVICAIYLQPIRMNEAYDYNKALKYARIISNTLDFKTVYNMGAFFLQRLNDLTSGLEKELQKQNTLMRRFKLVLLNWVQRLVSMLP